LVCETRKKLKKLTSNRIYNLENGSQVVDFINYVFRPREEYNSDPRYQLVSVYDKDILSIIWKYSHKFDQKTPLGFSKWLNLQNIDLISTEPDRKSIKTNENEKKLRCRQLYVLDNKYYGKFEIDN
jgi:hypothetical protein